MKLEQLNKEIKKLTFNELLEVYNMVEDASNDEDQTRYNERIKENLYSSISKKSIISSAIFLASISFSLTEGPKKIPDIEP